VVSRTGILEKVIAFKDGASIETTNELYDPMTGDVLVSSVQNEFKDKTYSTSVPAYWAYDKMGHSYKNNNLFVVGVEFEDGIPTLPYGLDKDDYLVEGDQLIVYNQLPGIGNNIPAGINTMAWLYKGDDGVLNLIDKSGYPIPLDGKYAIRVIKSGRQNTPSAPIMQVATTSYPSDASNKLSFDIVLNVSANEYKEDWNTHLGYFQFQHCDTQLTDYYTDLTALLQELDNHSAAFENKYVYNYFDRKCEQDEEMGAAGGAVTVGNSLVEVSRTPNLIKALDIKPARITSCEEQPNGNEVYYYCDCDKKYDLLFTKDQNGVYHKVNETLIGGITTSGTTDPSLLSAKFYVWNDHTSAYIELTLEEILDHDPNGKMRGHEDFDLAGINQTIVDDVVSSSQIMASPLNKKELVYNEDKNQYEIHFGYPVDQSCLIEISLGNLDVSSISEFLSFTVISPDVIQAEAIVVDQYGVTDTVTLYVKSSCGEFMDCDWKCGAELRPVAVNPYLTGLRGNWRGYKSWAYMTNRDYDASDVRTRTDGTFENFSALWDYDAQEGRYVLDQSSTRWVEAGEITKYSPFGQELENKNPLDQYSSAMYGYNHTLPTAVASNATYGEMYFDGFEEYGFADLMLAASPCPALKMAVQTAVLDNNTAAFDMSQHHSGHYSIKLDAASDLELNTALDVDIITAHPFDENTTYVTKPQDDIGAFKPSPGKYVVGLWVKEDADAFTTSYDDVSIDVELKDANNQVTTVTLQPKGKIIEGWQRIEGYVEINSDHKSMKIIFKGSDQNTTFVDDFRFHPFNGNMKSYVYDYRSLRLMAELDENNYATFYEYDQEGSLQRVKKETINGVATLQETRTHLKSNN
jgi:hypothetical protein